MQILPAGNSLAITYENGMISGLPAPYNRRVGLLLSRTAYPGNSLGIAPVRPGSSGQSQLTETFFYEPIFNQLCAGGAAGQPDQRDGRLLPAAESRHGHAPRGTPRSRPMTTRRTIRARSAAIRPCRRRWGSSAAQIDALYTFVNTQMGNAGLTPFQTGFPSGLGDINGDGTGNGASSGLPAARHLGNVVQVQHPTVNLINPDPNTGSTTQNRIEVFTCNALGQTTTHTDPNGNLTVYVRYPYNDPEGNGGATAPGLSAKQYGRVKEVHVDANPNDVLSLVGSDGDLRGLHPRPHGNYPLQLAGRLPGPGHPLRRRQRGGRQRLRVVRL